MGAATYPATPDIPVSSYMGMDECMDVKPLQRGRACACQRRV